MRVTALIGVLLALMLPAEAFAGSARMAIPVGPGLTAEADYWPGEADRPAVLILHGFLVTREFSTVRRLAEALADEGYSVLTPTLSLGLNRRQQSLACEAMHTHSMEQDLAELRAWVHWLRERSGKAPVLVGHSAGGVQLAALVAGEPPVEAAGAILVSLSYFGEEQGAEEVARLRARARADQAGLGEAMRHYALTYCRSYVTTPANLLSYLDWDRDRLRQALLDSAVPVTVIYGDRDQRIDMAWIEQLGQGGVTVRAVAGANHFFDLAHEFDLLDEVMSSIEGLAHG